MVAKVRSAVALSSQSGEERNESTGYTPRGEKWINGPPKRTTDRKMAPHAGNLNWLRRRTDRRLGGSWQERVRQRELRPAPERVILRLLSVLQGQQGRTSPLRTLAPPLTPTLMVMQRPLDASPRP